MTSGGFGPFSSEQGPQNSQNDPSSYGIERALALIACVGAPVSLFLGGMLLSIIAGICGLVAYRKIAAIESEGAALNEEMRSIRKTARTGIIVSVIAFVLNLVSAWYFMPQVIQMMQSGAAPESILGAGNGGSAGSLTWG